MTNETKKYKKINGTNFIEKCKKHKKLILGIFLILVFFYFFIWTISQPFNTCPDEDMKWKICKYIAKHGTIPQGGNEEIRDSNWGISYAFQPILTYMIGGVFVKIASFFTTDKFALVVAARLVSTISMTLSGYFVIKISQKLFKGIYKYLFIAIIVFQPITAFLASYINNDSTAVLATTMIIYLWILGLESNWRTKHCILLGLSIGFCSLTYYNAYGYILCSVILCLVSVISNKMKIKEILQKVLIVALMAFSVAGWWFLRNAIIYDGDILGMKTQVECGDKYAIDIYKPSKRETPQRNNESLVDMLIKDDWVKATLKSFVGIFGYQNIIMSNRIYQFYLLLWIVGSIGCIFNFKNLFVYDKKEKNKYLLNYIFIPSIIIPIILSIYYSYTSDYQAQGRYIMGIIIPFTYFIVSGIKTIFEKFIKSEKIKNIIIILIMIIIVLIAQRALFGYVIPTYK